MTYLKHNEPRDNASIYEQNFKNEFTLTISQSTIVKMKNSGVLSQIDVEIAKFLYEFGFATAAQLLKFFNIKFPNVDFKDLSVFKERLEVLAQNRVVNKFMFVDTKERKTVHDDAFQVYCLDLGGKYLLGNYSQCDLANWNTSLNMKSPSLVFKTLDIVDFYLNLLATCGKKVVSFRLQPHLRIGKVLSVPDADMCLKIQGIDRHFIIQFVSGEDYPHKYKDRAYQLETLLGTKAWSKYYGSDKMPMLLFITDDDDSALEVSKFIHSIMEPLGNINFACSTTTRIRSKKLNSAGGLMRYSNGTLNEIKAVAFNPE